MIVARAVAAAAFLLLAGCGHEEAAPVARGTGAAAPGVRLAPAAPDVTTDVRAVVEVRGTDPARCGYRWTRNGTAIEGEHGAILAAGRFRKGDAVGVVVSLPAAGGTLRADARIGDAAPRVSEAWITSRAGAKGYLFASVTSGADPDGDVFRFRRQWYRNGERIPGATDSTLALRTLAAGDRIAVEVTCSDGERMSEPLMSEELSLADKPPAFTSKPPAVASGDSVYRYQVAAASPGGGALRLDLLEAPPGASLSPEGLLEWRVPPPGQRANAARIVIRATDAHGGTATQSLELRVPDPVVKTEKVRRAT